jgi:hypothetical protein
MVGSVYCCDDEMIIGVVIMIGAFDDNVCPLKEAARFIIMTMSMLFILIIVSLSN